MNKYVGYAIYFAISIVLALALSIYVKAQKLGWRAELELFCNGPVGTVTVEKDEPKELVVYFTCVNNPDEAYYYIVQRS